MTSLFGKGMLDGFAENTLECTSLSLGDAAGKSRVENQVMENFMGMFFLRNSDKYRFGEMLVEYHKSYVNKDNKYPQTVSNMMDVMRQQPKKWKKKNLRKLFSEIRLDQKWKTKLWKAMCKEKSLMRRKKVENAIVLEKKFVFQKIVRTIKILRLNGLVRTTISPSRKL